MYRASAYQPRQPRQRLILIGAIVVRGEHHQAPLAFLFGTDKADDAVDSEGKAPLIEILTPACGSSWAQTAFTCTWLPSTKARPSICAHRLYGYLARIALAVVKLDDLGSHGPPPLRWSRRARFWERAVKPLATRPEIELPPRHVQPAACRTSRRRRTSCRQNSCVAARSTGNPDRVFVISAGHTAAVSLPATVPSRTKTLSPHDGLP